MPGRLDKCLLSLQWILGRCCFLIIGPLSFALMRLIGYRVDDLKAFRREIRAHFETHPGPWLICANHLTLIDSAIIAYALAPVTGYLFNYRMLPWNVPEQTNFQRNLFSTVFCYLAKCIPIRRRGDREQVRRCLDKCVWLLNRGEILTVFPEGTRSRSGRVDFQNVTYGVGRFLTSVPACRVLCLYLRGAGQDSYSNFPRPGERFHIRPSVLVPRTIGKGIRAQRAYALQIIARLAEMEQQYFALRGQ
ncbi:MAG: lysophospholipid acyltransferase family protein [Thermodesulfobacteriota bacterium]